MLVNRARDFFAREEPICLADGLRAVYKNHVFSQASMDLGDSTRMWKAYQALMLVLAQATDKQLAAQVQFWKAENEILRSKLKRNIFVSPADRRRLVKLGLPLGTAIRDLSGIRST